MEEVLPIQQLLFGALSHTRGPEISDLPRTLDGLKERNMSVGLKVATEVRFDDSQRRKPLAEEAEDAVQAANRELTTRAGTAVSTIVAVLAEQRDRALRNASTVQEQLRDQRDSMTAEQDRFIAFLMADYEKQIGELQKKLVTTRTELERRRALTPILPITDESAESKLVEAVATAEGQIVKLQGLLQAAYTEIDDTRKDAARLQEERDEAIRRIDESRQEFAGDLEAARVEANELQWKLDDVNRRLEDTRDEAREEAHRLLEELEESRRQLDESKRETWQSRTRLSELDVAMNTRPPPPGASELESARYEAQLLRKQLIDAKREHARLLDEFESARTRRGTLTSGRPDDHEVPTPRASQIYKQ